MERRPKRPEQLDEDIVVHAGYRVARHLLGCRGTQGKDMQSHCAGLVA